MTKEQPISYKRHRYPAEVISQCVWQFFRFGSIFRDVEVIMAERSVLDNLVQPKRNKDATARISRNCCAEPAMPHGKS